MTDSAPSGLAEQPLPDLHSLIRSQEWRRALAISRLTQAPAAVQEALGAVQGLQEAVRARRYPAARRFLADYQQLVSGAASGELSVLARQLDPQQLLLALQTLDTSQPEPEPAALEASLAPALALPLTRAEALNMQGVLHVLRAEPELARPLFEQALQADAGHYRALTNLGNLELEAGRFAEAESIYRQVLQLNPEYDGGHHNLGVALRRQGKVAAGVKAIRQGQKLSMRRSREDTQAEMREQFAVNPRLRWLRWAMIAGVLLLLFFLIQGIPKG